MANELTDSKENLRWADECIGKLEAAFKSFLDSEPYRVVREVDTQRMKVRERFIPEPVPWQLKFMARDVVHAVRIPLDILACRLAEANGQPTNGVYFPIRKSEAAFNASYRKIEKAFGVDVAIWLSTVEPYLGGDNLVWAVNEIDRVDKHTEIVSLIPGTGLSGVRVTGGVMTGGMNPMLVMPQDPDPVDNSIVFMSYDLRVADSVQYDRVRPFIAFREIGTIKGKSVPRFLREAHTRVAEIVADADNTFFLP